MGRKEHQIPETPKMHRWAFIDSKGRHRGVQMAATKKEAIAAFETNRYGMSSATPARPMGRLLGWTVLDRGVVGEPKKGHRVKPPRGPDIASEEDGTAPLFPLLATDGRVFRFRLNGETLHPVP